MLVADEIPQIILFKERGRDRTLRNEYKCRANRQRVPSARVTKFVKELSKPAASIIPSRRIYSRGISLMRERERENRFGDNVIIFLNLGEGRAGGGEARGKARSRSWRKKFVDRILKERPRAAGLHRNWFRKCRFGDKKRREKGENEGDREKEARNATAFTRSAFTCYVKFRWDPRYTTRRNDRRSLSRLGPFASQ